MKKIAHFISVLKLTCNALICFCNKIKVINCKWFGKFQMINNQININDVLYRIKSPTHKNKTYLKQNKMNGVAFDGKKCMQLKLCTNKQVNKN